MPLNTFVEMYLDWLNNFLSVAAFAAHYGISEEKAEKIIDLGRQISQMEI